MVIRRNGNELFCILLVAWDLLLCEKLRIPETKLWISNIRSISFISPSGRCLYIFTYISAQNLIPAEHKKGCRRYKNNFKAERYGSSDFLTPIILHTLFRIYYYGEVFPNTFYAKTGLSEYYLYRGWEYFARYAYYNLVYGALLILPLLLLKKKEYRFEFSLFYSLIITYTIYIIIIGGDVLPINRFFLPVLPLIFILFIKTLELGYENVKVKIIHKLRVLPLILLLAIGIGVGLYNQNVMSPGINNMLGYEKGLVKKMSIYADWVKERQTEKGEKQLVALSTIGAFSYYSNAKVIDLIGLTDEYIVNNPKKIDIPDDLIAKWKERKQNADYVLSQKPDYIIFPAGAKPSAFAESVMFSKKDFIYYYPQLIYSEELGQMIPIFTRKNKEQLALTVSSRIYGTKCEFEFIKPYIKANNNLLRYLKNEKEFLTGKIKTDVERMIEFCPVRLSEAKTVLASAYYHSGKLDKAKQLFLEAADENKFNTMAYLYLKDIFFREGDKKEAVKYLKKLKVLCPDALPGFKIKNPGQETLTGTL